MKNNLPPFLVFFCFFTVQIFAQNRSGEVSVLFYNVENLFDLKNDPGTLDEEFTPGGDRHWTYRRFNKKVMNLSKAILNAAGWVPPSIVALCETENRYVLECLIKDTPLKEHPYKIIHKESPDDRGIDVAFLYNKEVFYPLNYHYYPLISNGDSVMQTREILHVSGILGGTDTLHFFVNHWPSRYSGLMETQASRNLAASTLRSLLTQTFKKHHNAKVIILGDFNDQPWDESISLHLEAQEISDYFLQEDIINLSFQWQNDDLGTIKYRSQWSVFDQIMVSGSLLKTEKGLFTEPSLARIVKLPFLLEKDERYGGIKTNRTYSGYRYKGGFSDHLPVLLELKTAY